MSLSDLAGAGSVQPDISTGNSWGLSSTQTLDAGNTLTGVGETSNHPDVMVTLKVVGGDATLYVDLSVDGGSNYDTQIPFTVHDGIGEFHIVVKGSRTCRVRLTAGSDNLTEVRLHTEFGTFRQPNKGLQAAAYRDDDAAIVRPVDWCQAVQEGRWPDYTMETKFGINFDIDTTSTPADIWLAGGNYTGQPESFTPETVDVFSSDANDTSAGTGARTVRIYGLKTSSSTAYESEDITLNGTSAVTSSNAWWRVNRIIILTAGSGGGNAGTITVRSTTTTANVFAQVAAGYNQTQIAAWTVPAGCTAYLKRLRVALSRASGAAGSAVCTVRARAPGAVYRSARVLSITTNSPTEFTALGGSSFPEGTDIKVRIDAVSDNNSIAEAAMELLIVKD